MTPRIQKAIDIFLDAINEGTLVKGDCTKCAVGNLIKHEISDDYLYWSSYFCTVNNVQKISKGFEHILEVRRELDCTDFSDKELMAIEYAFETNTVIHSRHYSNFSKKAIREDQIIGLEAVVKVMLTFDDCQNYDVKEIFTNKAEKIIVYA